MQSSHTCHVNKTANFKTLTVLRQVTLRSGYYRIMFFTARRRERLGRGTGGRWTTCVTAGTATAARAWFFGVNTHSSLSLSDSESVTSGLGDGDCWPAASMVLVASRGRQWCLWLAGAVGGAGGWPGLSSGFMVKIGLCCCLCEDRSRVSCGSADPGLAAPKL